MPYTPATAPFSPGPVAPAHPTRATLQGASGTFVVLGGSEARVGRDATQCTITLPDPRVSSFHASLKVENGQLFVRDEGSNNGTTVDGAPVLKGSWSPVRHGGVLRFGPVDLTARLE
jgi:pSer/pThr/pTyr-binding forkhead associated (FHA) protein